MFRNFIKYHDIWIPEKLKSFYLKSEKSYWSEIYIFFLVSEGLSFRPTKQTLADM